METGVCLPMFCEGCKMVNEKDGMNQGGDEPPYADEDALAFSRKFNISLDKAKRLLEQHRAALAREVRRPKRR